MSQKVSEKPRRGRASTGAGAGSPVKGSAGGDKGNEASQSKSNTVSRGSQTDIDRVLETILVRLDKLDGKTDDDMEHRQLQKEHMNTMSNFMEGNQEQWNAHTRRLLIAEQQLKVANESNRKLESQINQLENQIKICNLRVEGKREVEGENMMEFMMDIARQTGAENFKADDIMSAERIGKRQNGQNGQRQDRPRVIMVTFRTRQARNKIYYGRARLHNTDMFRGIYINDDVSVLTRQQRDGYRSVAALARAQGADIRVHDDGIIIDGRKYMLGDEHLLPEKYSMKKAKTVLSGGELYFASQHSFLSNFAYAPIIEGETLYPTAEHFYQARKCENANDMERRQRVIDATTPLEAKRIADGIKETPEWRGYKDGVMEEVVGAKFDQNRELADKLMDTGVLQLNEATHNEHFGIGVALNSRAIKDKSYRGMNKLGKILMNKRDELNTEREKKNVTQEDRKMDGEGEQTDDAVDN